MATHEIMAEKHVLDTKISLTTHDIVQLNVFKGWNFSLEFKSRSIAQENSLEIKMMAL